MNAPVGRTNELSGWSEQLMTESRFIVPEERQIVGATRGLIAYLRDLVSAGNRPVLDVEAYEHVWWLADGFDQGPRQRSDGVLVKIEFEPQVPPPLPEAATWSPASPRSRSTRGRPGFG